jgi:NADPH:quinone reductase-like Zn-dependent oxidoreductase
VRARHPDGVDIVLHFAGDGAALSILLKSGGRLASTLGDSSAALERKDVTATPVMTIPSPELFSELAAAAASGAVKAPITKIYKLAQLAQALDDFSAGAIGKFVIEVK